MLTRLLQFSKSTALNKKVHRRQVFALLFGALPLVAAAKEPSTKPTKNTGYGKNTYGG